MGICSDHGIQRIGLYSNKSLVLNYNMEMSPVFPFCVPVAAGIVFVFMGNPKISTNYESPGIGGDRACPPEPLLRFAMVFKYLLWNYRSEGMPQRRGRRHYVP